MTKQELIKEEAAKTRIFAWIMFMSLIMFVGIVAINIKADQITHKFKSPSFNGVGGLRTRRIGVQGHDDRVAYRNRTIKEL